ncbi:MAG: gamma-glutamylcyclotransferase [Maritimibacter sp.]
MTIPCFFGYGSLVNTRTHDYPDARPARVTGWRRAWRHSPLRDRCFLTVVPDPDCEIDGLVATVPDGDWAALDLREHGYTRNDVSQAVRHDLGGRAQVAIYAIPTGAHHDPSADNPVVLSYLDAVVQGFLDVFGPEGVQRFFDTTSGWDQAPMLDDRAAPRYPRAQRLNAGERAHVDAGLARVGARVIKA